MKDNTKIRLRISKQLFESLTREILAESKKGMSGGAYTETVKAPKSKMESKKHKMEEMETEVAEESLQELKNKKADIEERIKKMESGKHKMEEDLTMIGQMPTTGAELAAIKALGEHAFEIGVTLATGLAYGAARGAQDVKRVKNFIKGVYNKLKKEDPQRAEEYKAEVEEKSNGKIDVTK